MTMKQWLWLLSCKCKHICQMPAFFHIHMIHDEKLYTCEQVYPEWIIRFGERLYTIARFFFLLIFVHLAPMVATSIINYVLIKSLQQVQKRRESILGPRNELAQVASNEVVAKQVLDEQETAIVEPSTSIPIVDQPQSQNSLRLDENQQSSASSSKDVIVSFDQTTAQYESQPTEVIIPATDPCTTQPSASDGSTRLALRPGSRRSRINRRKTILLIIVIFVYLVIEIPTTFVIIFNALTSSLVYASPITDSNLRLYGNFCMMITFSLNLLINHQLSVGFRTTYRSKMGSVRNWTQRLTCYMCH